MDIFNQHRALLFAPLTRPVTRRRVTIALGLLWLAVAGGGVGWQHPAPVLVNILIGFWLIYKALKLTMAAPQKTPWGPAIALMAIIAALQVSTLANGAWRFGPLIVLKWTWYLAGLLLIAHLNSPKWNTEVLYPAALLALLLYLLLLPIYNRFYYNGMASTILFFAIPGYAALKNTLFPKQNSALWGAFLGLGSMISNWGMVSVIYWLAILSVMIYPLDSWGGVLATLAAIFVLVPIKHKRLIFTALAGLIILAAFFHTGSTYNHRLTTWGDALAAAWPLGIGPGNNYLLNGWSHAHNTAINIIGESGLAGLIALIVAAISLFWSWTRLQTPPHPIWAATLAAAVIWSMVDDPGQILAPSIIILLAIANTFPRKGQLTNGRVQKTQKPALQR